MIYTEYIHVCISSVCVSSVHYIITDLWNNIVSLHIKVNVRMPHVLVRIYFCLSAQLRSWNSICLSNYSFIIEMRHSLWELRCNYYGNDSMLHAKIIQKAWPASFELYFASPASTDCRVLHHIFKMSNIWTFLELFSSPVCANHGESSLNHLQSLT